MGYFDLIRALRTGEPNPLKTATTMKYLGWGCLFAAIWNFIFPQIFPVKEFEAFFQPAYAYMALIVFTVIGAMFLLSARGIHEMEPWGRRAGQAAIVLLFAGIVLFTVWVMPNFARARHAKNDFTIFYVFVAIALAQFGLPAYFGVRYLGRLPVRSDPYDTANYNPDEIARSLSDRMKETTINQQNAAKYTDSPFPFGVMGTFLLLMGVLFLGMFIGQALAGPGSFGVSLPLLFLVIFVAPTIFNYLASPFQANRRVVAAFTGGGSIFLFNGSWPFFRLIVYGDALEVRVMFHRFLIPYEKMQDFPDKIGFFSTGILIRSDLPEVPSSIRFSGFGMKRIVQVVNEARSAFLAAPTNK